MKDLLKFAGNLLHLLTLTIVTIGLVVIVRGTGSTDSEQSPLPTPTQVTPSTTATPTPQPTSPVPTMTPWTPPTPQAQTPTPLPTMPVAQNPAGILLWRSQQLGFYEVGLDSNASVTTSQRQVDLRPPSNIPPGRDFYSQFKQFAPSPNGRYIVALGENEGGQYALVI